MKDGGDKAGGCIHAVDGVLTYRKMTDTSRWKMTRVKTGAAAGRLTVGVTFCAAILLHVINPTDGRFRTSDSERGDIVGEQSIPLPADRHANGASVGKLVHHQHAHRQSPESGVGVADSSSPTFFERCGSHRTCDRRNSYCDPVIGECARCDDDCNPARLDGDDVAAARCMRKCALWYRLQKKSQKTEAHKAGESSSSTGEQSSESKLHQVLMIMIASATVVIAASLLTIVAVILVCACRKSNTMKGRDPESHRTVRGTSLTTSSSAALCGKVNNGYTSSSSKMDLCVHVAPLKLAGRE